MPVSVCMCIFKQIFNFPDEHTYFLEHVTDKYLSMDVTISFMTVIPSVKH